LFAFEDIKMLNGEAGRQ